MDCKHYFVNGKWLTEDTFKKQLNEGLLQQMVDLGDVKIEGEKPSEITPEQQEMLDKIKAQKIKSFFEQAKINKGNLQSNPILAVIPAKVWNAFIDKVAHLTVFGEKNIRKAVNAARKEIIDPYLASKNVSEEQNDFVKEHLNDFINHNEEIQRSYGEKQLEGIGIKKSENFYVGIENDIPKIFRGRKGHFDTMAHAMNEVKDNPAKQKELDDKLNTLKEEPRILTQKEEAEFAAYKAIKSAELRDLTQELDELKDKSGEEAKTLINKAKIKSEEIERLLMSIALSSEISGRETARSLGIRAYLFDDNFDAYRELAKISEEQGFPPTESQKREALTKQKEYDKIQENLNKTNDELEQNEVEQKVDTAIENIASEHEEMVNSKGAEETTNEINKKKGTPKKSPEGKLSFTKEYVMSFHDQGITNPVDIVTAIQNNLEQVGIDATPREIADAISEYGSKKFKTPTERDIAFRRVKEILTLLSKIEDIKKGKLPPKNKTPKVKQSVQQKRLRTELNDLLSQFGYSDKQLAEGYGSKAQLDEAVDKQLKRVEELENQINKYQEGKVYETADELDKLASKRIDEINDQLDKATDKNVISNLKKEKARIEKGQDKFTKSKRKDVSGLEFLGSTKQDGDNKLAKLTAKRDEEIEKLNPLRDTQKQADKNLQIDAISRIETQIEKAKLENEKIYNLGIPTILNSDKDLKGEDKSIIFHTKEQADEKGNFAAGQAVDYAVKNGEYEQAIKDSKISASDVEKILKSYDVPVPKSISKLREIEVENARKNFDITPKQKKEVILNEQATKLKQELERIKADSKKRIIKIKEAQTKPLFKWLKSINNAIGISRGLHTFSDASGVAIQSGFLLSSMPYNMVMKPEVFKQQVYALGKAYQLAAFSKSKNLEGLAEDVNERIRKMPAHDKMVEAGLKLQMETHEIQEHFSTIALNRLPIIGETITGQKTAESLQDWKKDYALRMPKRSELSFIAISNLTRAIEMQNQIDAWENAGVDLNSKEGKEFLKSLASVINTNTGATSLGKAEGVAHILSGLMYSARLLVGKFKMYSPYSLYYIAKQPPLVRKFMMEKYMHFISAQMGVISLATATVLLGTMGDEDKEEEGIKSMDNYRIGNNKLSMSFNINSDAFLSLKTGNKSYPLTLGSADVMKTLFQLYNGYKYDKEGRMVSFKNGGLVGTRKDVAIDWLLGRSAPMTNAAIRKMDENNYSVPKKFDEYLLELGTPLFAQTVVDYVKDDMNDSTKTAAESIIQGAVSLPFVFSGIPLNIKKEKTAETDEDKAGKLRKIIEEVKSGDVSSLPQATIDKIANKEKATTDEGVKTQEARDELNQLLIEKGYKVPKSRRTRKNTLRSNLKSAIGSGLKSAFSK